MNNQGYQVPGSNYQGTQPGMPPGMNPQGNQQGYFVPGMQNPGQPQPGMPPGMGQPQPGMPPGMGQQQPQPGMPPGMGQQQQLSLKVYQLKNALASTVAKTLNW